MMREPELVLIRRRDQLELGRNDSELNRAAKRGEIIRVAPGSYANVDAWQSMRPMEQHRTRVLEARYRLAPDAVFSHFAAAALWGISILGTWPAAVDVLLDRATGGRSTGTIRRRCTGLDGVEVVELSGMLVTSPAQTVVDLARILPFSDAVVALDSAQHRKRKPRPLTTRAAIVDALSNAAGRRGFARAAAAVEFSTDLSDSAEESHSRVLIHTLGFPAPILQAVFELPNGGTAESDFYWPKHGHLGECDGRAKYRDPEYLGGRTSDDVVILEKNRENELRRLVPRMSRWEPAELYRPRAFYDRLTRDGLPSSKPRP